MPIHFLFLFHVIFTHKRLSSPTNASNLPHSSGLLHSALCCQSVKVLIVYRHFQASVAQAVLAATSTARPRPLSLQKSLCIPQAVVLLWANTVNCQLNGIFQPKKVFLRPFPCYFLSLLPGLITTLLETEFISHFSYSKLL